jgi:hypothetical protein
MYLNISLPIALGMVNWLAHGDPMQYPGKPDLAASCLKWKNEWGDEVANALVEYVKDTMADYEYLHKVRL